jgi:hypothetical protein
MVLQTVIIDVPEGCGMRHSFYKVKTLDPDYVETRGRKPYTEDTNLENKSASAKWKLINRDHVKEYNRLHYKQKKAVLAQKKAEEIENAQGV